MNILITGGNGFIGSHLADEISDNKLTLFDLKFDKNTEHLNVKKVKGDISKPKNLTKVIKNQDVVIHLAAVSRVKWGEENPKKCIDVNVYGTLNLLEAIRRLNPKAFLIFGSSREVYGDPIKLPVNEDHPKNPKSIYGTTKLEAENLIKNYNRRYGLKYLILRFSNVYGSERDHMDRVVPKFILNSLLNKPLEVYGPNNKYDFVFISDVINVLKKSLDKFQEDNLKNEAINVSTNIGTSLLELAKKVIKICNSKSQIHTYQPEKYFVDNFIGDNSKLKKLLNYKPKVLLDDGLKILKNKLKELIKYEKNIGFGLWEK